MSTWNGPATSLIKTESPSKNASLSSTLAAFAASGGMSEAGGRPPLPPAYVIVCGHEGGDAVELPLDRDGALPVKTLQIEFTEALGVKYRNPETGIYRIIAPDGGRLFPPTGGWGNHHYSACIPKSLEERPWDPRSYTNHSAPSPAIMRNSFESGSESYSPPSKVMAYIPPSGRGAPVRGIVGMMGGPRGHPMGMMRGSPRGRMMHRGAPRGRGGAPPPSPYTQPGEGQYTTRKPEKGKPTKDFDTCTVCGVTSNSESQAAMHYAGKKHLDKVAQQSGTAPRGRGMTVSI